MPGERAPGPGPGSARRGARAFRVLRQEGLGSFVYRTVEALWLYRRLDMVVGPLPKGNQRERIPIECGRLATGEVEAYLALRPDQTRAAVEARLAGGELCLVARHEGRLVAATWVALHRCRIDHVACEIELAPDAFYGYDTFVAPDRRGLRVADGLGTYRNGVLASLGRTTGVGLFWPENRVARHRRERRRYNAPAAHLVSYGLGPWRRCVLRVEPGVEVPVRVVG